MTTVATQYPRAFVEIKPRKQREPVQVFSPEAWVDKHGDYLYNYAMQRLHDRELAEEMIKALLLLMNEPITFAAAGAPITNPKKGPKSWVAGRLSKNKPGILL